MKNNELIFGFHAVKTLLQKRPDDVLKLYVQSGRKDQRLNEILKIAKAAGVPYESLDSAKLSEIAGKQKSHQGIVAECKQRSAQSSSSLMDLVSESDSPLLLILDGVQDPHNLGACFRSANAFGVTAVVVPKDRSVQMTDVVRKVASGSTEHTPFFSVTNLHRTMKALQDAGVWFVGLDGAASAVITDIDMTGPIAIVMGNEGQGMRRLTRSACDYLAKIPMQGDVGSLNVSVATGITLYEVQRQRGFSA